MYIESAKSGKNQFWRYLIGVLIIILSTQIIGALPLLGLMIHAIVITGNLTVPANPTDFSAMGIDPNLGLMAMLFPFAVGLVFIYIVIRKIHQRPFLTLLTSRTSFSWPRFWFGALLWTLLMSISLIGHYMLEPGNYSISFDYRKFIPLALISLTLIPLQAGFEELLFRGYLMQGFGLLFRNKWLPLLITGFGFGLLHAFNPEVHAYGFWLTMPQYIGLGLFFGLLVLLDEGLELALGIHILNNIFLSLFLTDDNSALQTSAVFHAGTANPVGDLIEMYIFMIIFLLLAQVKFRWSGWRSFFMRKTLQ